MYNYKMVIAYDGTKYSGWQRNKNAKDTIQHKCDQTLSKFFQEQIKVIGAGRTDKGVHAKGMVANFNVSYLLNTDVVKKELNHYLPADIALIELSQVDERFHSRFSAKSKTYEYTYVKAYEAVKPIFDRPYVTMLEEACDLALMKEAAKTLIGKHDYKGFSSDRTKKSTIRTITSIEIQEDRHKLVFTFKGDGFLYHMVRILVGTLVEIGQGKKDKEIIKRILENKVREEAGHLVPAQGLCLLEVNYE